ncbi:translocation/assembly module TamB domain-containing protein [Comamonas sp. MYb21]|uniref:translocation/assembly module TamB domain-containing protein n=1 Tax=Comamonas sp. MYb21 TaxID=1848648 RepID=UPI00309A660A
MADTHATAPTASAAQPAASPPSGPSSPKKRSGLRRAVRVLLWLFVALILLLAALLGGAWWWTGQNDSLARSIALAQRFLPADMQLQAQEVSGSLRGGGSIGQLQWSNPSISVQVDQATIGWSLDKIWDRELRLAPIHIAKVSITPSGIDQPKEPSPPLEQLPLPLRVLEVPFAVDEIVWAAPQPITVTQLQGHYLYAADKHQLQIDKVEAFNSRLQLKADVDALAPMQIAADLKAQLDQPATDTLPAILADAGVQVTGTLSGLDAALRVQAQVKPQFEAAAPKPTAADAPALTAARKKTAAKAPSAQEKAAKAQAARSAEALAGAAPMQADVDATVYPWRPWPLGPAQAQLQSVNLAAFLPSLPTTLLNGQLAVTEAAADLLSSTHTAHPAPALVDAPVDPMATSSAAPAGSDTSDTKPAAPPALLPVPLDIQIDISNALPGPINHQLLPVSAVQTHALFDGQRVDVLEGSEVQLGSGNLSAQGHYRLADHHAGIQAALRAINPALVDTRIDSATLSGSLSAQSQNDAIVFDANITSERRTPAKATAASTSLPIDRVIAKGQWKAPALQLQSAQIDALGAHISAKQLTANIDQRSGAGELSVQAPGANLDAKAQAAPQQGQGTIALRLSSAEQLLQWLRKLPGMAQALPEGMLAQGSLDAKLRFSGGYGDALRQLQQAGLLAQLPAGIPSGGQPFALDANISTPQLSLRTSADAADLWQLRDTELALVGNLKKVQLDLRAQAQHGEQQMAAQVSLAANSTAAKQWSGALSKLQARATLPPNKAPWQVQLQQPLDFKLQLPAGNQPLRASTGASQLQLTGPEPGTVTLQWNPLQFSQGADQAVQLQSTGSLQGLPLRWIRAFQKPDPSQAQKHSPFDSDLVVQGRWDVNTQNGLNAKVEIERASGDLQLHTQGSAPTNVTFHSSGKEGAVSKAFSAEGQTIIARIRTAKVELTVQDRQLRSRVQWDSVNAGQLTADVQTALQYEGKNYLGATMAPDAPLSGNVQAQMPDLGIWASFAPPGWRVAGSLAANVQLAGNLQDPRWSGSITADKMRIQSQLDGVDLRNGSLRAQLNGNTLELQSLHFDGGEGSRARIAGYSGNLTAAPTSGGTLDATGTISWTMPQNGAAPDIRMDIRTQAKALQVLVRADRQVSVSGQVRSQLQQGQMSITGDLTVDRASIMLADESSPTLGSDVVVSTKASRAAAAEKAKQEAAKAAQAKLDAPAGRVEPAKPLILNIKLDMGRDFALQGYGITTRLTGTLNVQSSGGAGIGMPRITGVISTEEGRYRAWGQVLNVETGLIRFNGPYNNPSLDILALRPNISVKAGVQVSGSAQAPRVSLYSNPEMPDAEKISWVVMGRDPAGGGASSALMQQAALALLSGGSGESVTGNIAKSLGLDEIGFGGTDRDSASLSVGKRLSQDLYVTYEAGLAGTLGALYIFFDFTRNLQLRGSAGTTSALDLIYTLRYD